MRFIKNWDEKLINYLLKCPSVKSILTTYPLGYELPNKIPLEKRTPFLIADSFDSSNFF